MTRLPSPSHFFPTLSNDRLEIIASRLLEVRHATFAEMNSPFDDNYTKEGAAFGRCRNMLIGLALSGEFSWLSLLSPAMDVTFSIENVPCRFFRDNPDSPEKPGFFKRNSVDSLFAEDARDPVIWRFVIEKALNEDSEDRAFLFGYNTNQEKVSAWEYKNTIPPLASVDSQTPSPANIPPANVDIWDDEMDEDQGEAKDGTSY